jgi:hypothetical protein
MAVLLTFPSLGALVILPPGAGNWFEQPTLLGGLGVVKFEEWIALALLALHAAFTFLAWRFHRTEPVRENGDLVPPPNPDHDLNKLY